MSSSSPESKRRHYLKHQTEILRKRKSNYAANPELYRERQRRSVEGTPEKFIGALLRQITKRCRYKKIYTKAGVKCSPLTGPKTIVEITLDYLLGLWRVQNGKCSITHLPLSHKYGEFTTISIDRIDSGVGYIIGNVQLVCQGINLLKGTHTNDEVREFLGMVFGALEGTNISTMERTITNDYQ